MQLILIFLAGGTGCVLRYLVGGWFQRLANGSFPVGTLVCNVVGCGVIGALVPLLTGPVLIREEYRMAILIGLLGGFTTFSSFGWETLTLADRGQFWFALVNIALSVSLGLAAAWAASRIVARYYGL